MGAQRHESSYATLWRLNRQKKICACMPVYRVLLGSKFLRVSVHMINCLLTEFGWVGWENIWHSFVTHDVIEHEK